MKKAIIPYLAGIFTVLIFSAIFNIVTEKQIDDLFENWTKNKEEKIVSNINSDAGVVAVLKNIDPVEKENKNMTSSRWNEKRIVLTPNREKEVYVDVELRDGQWSKVKVFDLRSHKQVAVSFESDNQLQWAQILGTKHVSMDKNLDGLVDLYSEYPPKVGKNGKSKVFYVTESGTTEKVFGESFTEEGSGKKYQLIWNGSEWEKEYKE